MLIYKSKEKAIEKFKGKGNYLMSFYLEVEGKLINDGTCDEYIWGIYDADHVVTQFESYVDAMKESAKDDLVVTKWSYEMVPNTCKLIPAECIMELDDALSGKETVVRIVTSAI